MHGMKSRVECVQQCDIAVLYREMRCCDIVHSVYDKMKCLNKMKLIELKLNKIWKHSLKNISSYICIYVCANL